MRLANVQRDGVRLNWYPEHCLRMQPGTPLILFFRMPGWQTARGFSRQPEKEAVSANAWSSVLHGSGKMFDSGKWHPACQALALTRLYGIPLH